MKKINLLAFAILIMSLMACAQKSDSKESTTDTTPTTEEADLHEGMDVPEDDRFSLDLLPKQKRHQLQNMRSHLVAIQTLIELIAQENYDLASKVAYTELGSTTEMQLMCASFGNKDFENLGLEFHASADKMSKILKTGNKKKSLEALAVTMNYCVSCHASFKQ